MIFTSILILIMAKAIPSISNNLCSQYFTRISSIVFIYSGVLSLNTLYIQSIGSGIGIYSGLFQVTQVSVLIESFLLIIGSLILISWPISKQYNTKGAESNTGQTDLISESSTFSPPSTLSYATQDVQAVASNSLALLSTRQGLVLNKQSTDYSLIVLFSSLGSCLLISSYDLVSLYISIELQSFGLYVLSTLYRDSETSTKAGLKYFLLGGLSSCIILLGCGIIYSYTGLTNFESIYSIISTSNSLTNLDINLLNGIPSSINLNYIVQGLILGLILIFIGFLFKIAAAPLHNWSPDVYDEVPTIVTIWLTIIPKISILVVLLELQYYGFSSTNLTALNFNGIASDALAILPDTYKLPEVAGNIDSIIKNLLLISSILSLIIGTVVGLAQTRVKRLLAYSTISHIGFILLALALNTESSIDSLLFYIIQYTITNLNIFLIIIALSYVQLNLNNSGNLSLKSLAGSLSQLKLSNNDIRYISELKGKFVSNPMLSISLAICLFSMAGIPPLIGFFSKQFVLYSAIQNGYYFISFIAILVSVISASYYIKIVKVIFTPETELEDKNSSQFTELVVNSTETENSNLSNLHSYLISILTLSILLFILKPSLILNSTQLLSLSLFNC